jgi:hypothetical protein
MDKYFRKNKAKSDKSTTPQAGLGGHGFFM